MEKKIAIGAATIAAAAFAVLSVLKGRKGRKAARASAKDDSPAAFPMPLAKVRAAEAVVRECFAPTPILFAPRLSALFKTNIYLKLESTTPTRTFKVRGALNKIACLPGNAGVITASKLDIVISVCMR
jgi:hypothetical protein